VITWMDSLGRWDEKGEEEIMSSNTLRISPD
jgi:hypothetical protein